VPRPIDHGLARVTGDDTAAVAHFTRAVEISERIGAVPRSAHARARLAEARAGSR